MYMVCEIYLYLVCKFFRRSRRQAERKKGGHPHPVETNLRSGLTTSEGVEVSMSRQQVQTLQNYFGGRWVPAETDEVLEVHNPATDEVLAHVPMSGGADVDAAVAAAAASVPAWRATPPQERARYFF